jgi:integrase
MSIIKPSKTIQLPKNATIIRKSVTWIDSKGKKHIGKLTKNKRVLVESACWQIRYRDETGKERRESTKTRNKEIAQNILAQREKEVERIKMGIASRQEINQQNSQNLNDLLKKYRNKMTAEGVSESWIKESLRKINLVAQYKNIENIKDLSRENIEAYIANEIKEKKKTPKTINAVRTVLSAFFEWAVDCEYVSKNPAKKIKKLNENIGRKKIRRSFSEDELNRIFDAAKKRKYRKKNKAEENILIYRLLVGMGLRSTELSLARPHQINFEQNRFTVIPEHTKNKEPDVLPIRPDLAKDLKAWIERFGIAQDQRIFTFNRGTIRNAFLRDLAAAGIPQKNPDGRSVDVHSLRRTFGTMLARAGVPLTTTQRLMRHSTPELTAKLYIDVEPIEMATAIEKLPRFGK